MNTEEKIKELAKDNLKQRRMIVDLSNKIISYSKLLNDDPYAVLEPIIGKKLAQDFTE